MDVDVWVVYGGVTEDEGLLAWLKERERRYLLWVADTEESFWSGAYQQQERVRRLLLHDELGRKIAWEYLFLRFGYKVAEGADRTRGAEFFQKLGAQQQEIHLLASEVQDFGRKALGNMWANLSYLPFCTLLQQLKGCCRGMPALVCGAGPSLDRVELRGLRDHALWIAAGSATGLTQEVPHLCVYGDPDPPEERFSHHRADGAVHAFLGRFSSSLVAQLQGPRVWIPHFGLDLMEGWIEQALGVGDSSCDGGWTSGTLAVRLAHDLGCNPIIVVGMDFARDHGGAFYAGGIEGHAKVPSEWELAAKWLSDFATAHPETEWIRASHEGVEIPGLERRSGEEIYDLLSRCQYDVVGQLHAAIASQQSGILAENVMKVQTKIRESFIESRRCCGALLELFARIYPRSPADLGEYALLWAEWEEQIVYQRLLEPLWRFWQGSIARACLPEELPLHQVLFFQRVIDAYE